MSISESQAVEILTTHIHNSNNLALVAAMRMALEWRAEKDWLTQQRTSIYHDLDRLHKLCKEKCNDTG